MQNNNCNERASQVCREYRETGLSQRLLRAARSLSELAELLAQEGAAAVGEPGTRPISAANGSSEGRSPRRFRIAAISE